MSADIRRALRGLTAVYTVLLTLLLTPAPNKKKRLTAMSRKPLILKELQVRAQGLEPWTYGLKVRCSTN